MTEPTSEPPVPGDTTPALEVSHLDVAYRVRSQDRLALRDVSFSIGRGESYGLVGESGSGKSTVALALVGYLPRNGRVSGGTISINGRGPLSMGKSALRDPTVTGLGLPRAEVDRTVPCPAGVPTLPQAGAGSLPEHQLRGAVRGDGRARGRGQATDSAELAGGEVERSVPRPRIPRFEEIARRTLVEDELRCPVGGDHDAGWGADEAEARPLHGPVPGAREPHLGQAVVSALPEHQLLGAIRCDRGAGGGGEGAEVGEVGGSVPHACVPGLPEVVVRAPPVHQLLAVLGGHDTRRGRQQPAAAPCGGPVDRPVPYAR